MLFLKSKVALQNDEIVYESQIIAKIVEICKNYM